MSYLQGPTRPNRRGARLARERAERAEEKAARPKRPRHPVLFTNRWRQMRKAILERDDYTCRYCRSPVTEGRTDDRAAIIHHKISPYDNESLALEPSNLETTCRSCHFGIIQSREKTGLPQLDEDGYPVTHG